MKNLIIRFFLASSLLTPVFIQSMERQNYIGIRADASLLELARIYRTRNLDKSSFKSVLSNREEEYTKEIKNQETIIERLDQDLGNIDKARSDNKRLFQIGNYTFWSGILTLCANRLFPLVSPLTKEFWSKYPTFSLLTCTSGLALSGYGLVTLFIQNNHETKIDEFLNAKSDLTALKELFSEENIKE